MFVEYIRILDFRATGDAGVNYYQLLLKLGIIGTVGVALIYLAYKAFLEN